MKFAFTPCIVVSIIAVFCLFKEYNAINCYICDSALNATCATGVDSDLEYVECERFEKMCAMTIIDGDTYRGCANKIPTGSKFYKACNESLCNGKVYPPGRLKCYQCSGPSCVAAPQDNPTACWHHEEIDSCYTDIISDEDGKRGCISDKEVISSDAIICERNGCNNLEGFTDLVCSSCDTNSGKGCVRKLLDLEKPICNIELEKNCTVRSLLGRPTESCFIYQNASRVVRGCTSYNDELNSTNEEFQQCNGDFCNRLCIEEVKCLQCNSVDDESCFTNPDQITPKLCVSGEIFSCHSCEYPNEKIERGCGIPNNFSMCSLCSGSAAAGCNNQLLTKCYNCDSENNADCVHWLRPENISQRVCLTPEDQCGVVTKADGHTQRGCKSLIDPLCVEAYGCNFCSESLCNDDINLMPDILSCYHCNPNSNDTDDCSNVTNIPHLPCTKYQRENRCFEFLNDNYKMMRGCASDQLYQECLDSKENCIECDSNGCNDTPLQRDAIFSCHVCSEDNPACAYHLDKKSETLTKCKTLVNFDKHESCYTLKINETSVIRGCTLDDKPNATAAIHRNDLNQCDFNECNGNSVFVQKCIQCNALNNNTLQNNTCIENVNIEELSRTCSFENITYDLRGCFVKRNGENLSRGCIADLSSEDLAECNQSNTQICLLCNGLNCNTKNLSGGAALHTISSLCFLIIVFLFK